MAYIVYIDISAKIEQWQKDSVIAVANDHSRTLLISSNVKAQTRALIEELYPSKTKGLLQYRMLAIFTYIAVRPSLTDINRIVIDRDYSGQLAERHIKRLLVELLRRDKPKFKARQIQIANIAGTNADVFARKAYRGQREIDDVISIQEIEEILRG